MHGLNLSTIPEILDGATLLNADGDLGGMRNLLPLPASSMFGAGKDPQDLRKLMRKAVGAHQPRAGFERG